MIILSKFLYFFSYYIVEIERIKIEENQRGLYKPKEESIPKWKR